MFKVTASELRDLIIAFIFISLSFSILYSGRNFDLLRNIFPVVMIGLGLAINLLQCIMDIGPSSNYGRQD